MHLTEQDALAMYLILKACIVENDVEGARHYMRRFYGNLDSVMTFASQLYDTIPVDHTDKDHEKQNVSVVVLHPKTGEKCEACQCGSCVHENKDLDVNEAHKGE